MIVAAVTEDMFYINCGSQLKLALVSDLQFAEKSFCPRDIVFFQYLSALFGGALERFLQESDCLR